MADTSMAETSSQKLFHRTKKTTANGKHDGGMSVVQGNSGGDEIKKPSGSFWKRSLNAAFRGGASGSIAMVLQVVLLMWLRTAVNYQYKHGVDTRTAFSKLYGEGGVPRFYKGMWMALLTGPVARFGDTAANEGVRDLLRNSGLPVWAVTLTASLMAAFWRVLITPLDCVKTTLQVGSEDGWRALSQKIRANSPLVLWDGALGNSLATLAGHYPWFIVNNFLEARLPKPAVPDEARQRRLTLLRRALIGFCSSFVSDCVSNGIRVVKTYQQTSEIAMTYREAFSELLAANGLAFCVRGLGLKIVTNGLSGILFSVLWKMIMEHMNHKSGGKNPTSKQQTAKVV